MDNKQDQVTNERLTDINFWNSCYEGRVLRPFDETDWKNYVSIQLVRKLESLDLRNKKVCEVGGGDGQIIAYLAKRYPKSEFFIIDFSPVGCQLAEQRARTENVKLNIIQADIFSPPKALIGYFDIVVSHGVVEHFSNLSRTLKAKACLIRECGLAFTLIPNLSSPIYSTLCKRWSKTVFEDHIPHDMKSFLDGHKHAGLTPTNTGYLGSVEFGMLSMAMSGPEKKSWLDKKVYLYLTRISKIVHFMEYHFLDLPASGLLSPFLYAISQKNPI